MIYIDDGKTVKILDTNKKIENAVYTLLTYEDVMCSETHVGYGVEIVCKEHEQ